MRNYGADERVIAAFLNNYRVTDIAKAAGISRGTVYKLRRDSEFMTAISDRKAAIVEAAVNRMTGYMIKNVETLQKIADDPEEKSQVRINAINLMATQQREWMIVSDLQKRVMALEATPVAVIEQFEGADNADVQ
ncbi:MAG: hypothetical protein IJI14_13480 [Anaerolineaceae bacterium]|nr:hypothetical protein [Anaerolineaceae bacterium]